MSKSDTQVTEEQRAQVQKPTAPGEMRLKEPLPKPQDVGLANTSRNSALGPTETGLLQGGQQKQSHPADKK